MGFEHGFNFRRSRPFFPLKTAMNRILEKFRRRLVPPRGPRLKCVPTSNAPRALSSRPSPARSAPSRPPSEKFIISFKPPFQKPLHPPFARSALACEPKNICQQSHKRARLNFHLSPSNPMPLFTSPQLFCHPRSVLPCWRPVSQSARFLLFILLRLLHLALAPRSKLISSIF